MENMDNNEFMYTEYKHDFLMGKDTVQTRKTLENY